MNWRDFLVKLPLIGRTVRSHKEDRKEAEQAKEKSASSLEEARKTRVEGQQVERTLRELRIQNHFAERYRSAYRGVADDPD